MRLLVEKGFQRPLPPMRSGEVFYFNRIMVLYTHHARRTMTIRDHQHEVAIMKSYWRKILQERARRGTSINAYDLRKVEILTGIRYG